MPPTASISNQNISTINKQVMIKTNTLTVGQFTPTYHIPKRENQSHSLTLG